MSEGFWITGIGTANPLGTSYEETARHLLAGTPGVHRIERFDTSRQHSQVAGLVREIPVPAGHDEASFRKRDRMDQLVLWCGIQALRDAGLWGRQSEARVGVVLGNGGEWLRLWEADWQAGGRRIQTPEVDDRTTVQFLKRELGLIGPVLTTASACASGNYALAEARKWVQRGWVDFCLVGAVDLTVSPMGLSAFGNLRALSTKRNDRPEAASRPFDMDRDGFVMAEGGAIFVLEPERTARKRGAKGYADLIGFGSSSDGFHMVIPSSDPEPMANAMKQAMADAGISPQQVDYVNAHATSTPVGDAGESRAIRMALGEAAATVPVSSTKGMTGHVVCAAAAIETIACIAAFEHQTIPPTINLDELDPDCAGLCHIANQAQPRSVRIALNNSFGFGGSNTSLALRKFAWLIRVLREVLMFTPEDRTRLRDGLIAAARADARITGAALTGSAALQAEDRWSDIDLAFAVAAEADFSAVVAEWTERMYRDHGAIHHVDVNVGNTLFRVFLLANTLQVDLAFWPAAGFGAIAPSFRLLFGKANERPPLPPPTAAGLIGMGWLYALHARSTIARGKVWQAEYMISGVRDHVLALACLRHGVSAVHARGIDRVPPEAIATVAESLVRSLDLADLRRAFAAVTESFVAEIERADAELARRLAGPLRELAK